VTFSERARRHVERRLPAAAPHSAEEMFLRLLDHGAQARAAGNYGIAAAFVLRASGTELVCFGENTVFSDQDPSGHAEMNALKLARRLATADAAERSRLLGDPRSTLVRGAPHDRTETLLYSTLEPCPMCTVALLNAGVGRVYVAEPDEAAGALLHLDSLPPLWPKLAAARGVDVVLSTESTAEDRVSEDLVDLLKRLFLDGKDELDRLLTEQPALPVAELSELARTWRRSLTR
jgi:tRNA(Arg) A34 adenosine deaminase TadA